MNKHFNANFKVSLRVLPCCRSIRLSVLLLLVTACSGAHAITVTAHKPPYWSGTHCMALGNLNNYGGSTLKWYKLKIGGETIKTKNFPAGEQLQHITVKARFDSTRFPAFQTLRVEIEAATWDGNTSLDHNTVLVKNRATPYDTARWANDPNNRGGVEMANRLFNPAKYCIYSIPYLDRKSVV